MLVPLAAAAVRTWTRLYTRGLPTALADRRRAEVESDLWECQHDRPATAPPRVLAAHILARLAFGIPDDLLWRVERLEFAESLAARRLVAAVGTAAAMIGVFGAASTTRSAAQEVRAECASDAPAPYSTADLRLRIIGCAGALFLAEKETR